MVLIGLKKGRHVPMPHSEKSIVTAFFILQ